MSLLNMFFSLFNLSEIEMKDLPWRYLTSLEQIDDLVDESNFRLIIIFKHSKRCGISRMVLKEFIRKYSLTERSANLYFLDIFGFRELSNEIAHRFGVVHESPQIILIKDEKVVHHASHYRIKANRLNEFISIDA